MVSSIRADAPIRWQTWPTTKSPSQIHATSQKLFVHCEKRLPLTYADVGFAAPKEALFELQNAIIQSLLPYAVDTSQSNPAKFFRPHSRTNESCQTSIPGTAGSRLDAMPVFVRSSPGRRKKPCDSPFRVLNRRTHKRGSSSAKAVIRCSETGNWLDRRVSQPVVSRSNVDSRGSRSVGWCQAGARSHSCRKWWSTRRWSHCDQNTADGVCLGTIASTALIVASGDTANPLPPKEKPCSLQKRLLTRRHLHLLRPSASEADPPVALSSTTLLTPATASAP